jgi:hypothetical protein
MTELLTKVFFKSATGIHEVRLPANEAVLVAIKHPHEWSLTHDGFADPPAGHVFSESTGGGLGRVQGASVRVD